MGGNTTYIIGAGLNGLIAAYYLKNCFIIDDVSKIGGQFANSFSLGPRYIRKDENFIKLLKELKIRYKIKKIRIGYHYQGKIHHKLNRAMKKEYAIKTRNSKDDKSFLCDKNNNFEYLDFDYKTLITKLYNSVHNRFIDEQIKKIYVNDNCMFCECNKCIIYTNKLISTIHYKDFCKLMNVNYVSKNKDIYFYLLKRTKKDYKNYDFIYFIDKNNPINRITYQDKYKIIESPSDFVVSEDMIIQKTKLTDYKLSNKNKIKKFRNIFFLGRYANLDNSKRINSIFEDIKWLEKHLQN